MTPLNIFIIFFLVQISGYILLDSYNLKNWKYLLLCVLLAFYIFILPSYFIPDNPTNEPICGMPVLGITLAIWIFGFWATLLTHLAYLTFKTFVKAKK
jgi:ABC-type Co2+ transport system permease subunit